MTARTGIVLAGGRSIRFGDQDKALAKLCGRPLLTHVVQRVSRVTSEIIVSCRESSQESYRTALADIDANINFVPDPIPDQGPLVGLRAALGQTKTSTVAVVGCDMPAVDPEFLAYLFGEAGGHDGAVPESADGIRQPAQAVYQTDAITAGAKQALDSEQRSLRQAVARLDVAVISPSTVRREADRLSLRNINRREELEALEAEFC